MKKIVTIESSIDFIDIRDIHYVVTIIDFEYENAVADYSSIQMTRTILSRFFDFG